MSTVNFNKLIKGKVEELTSKINVLKVANVSDATADDFISPNTRSTQLNKLRRERDVLNLISSLITTDTKLSDKQTDLLVRLTTLSSERATTRYVFNEGDSIFEVMQKYEKIAAEDAAKKERIEAIQNMIELGLSEEKILTKYTREDYEEAL